MTKRRSNQLRPIRITRGFLDAPDGAVLIEMGQTRVLCTANIEQGTPKWLTDKAPGTGWVTAEYNMLPASTSPRKHRASPGRPDGRGVEIQRLIGRALRTVVDRKKLGEHTIWLDCEVLQADGGTRCAAITGAWVALVDACRAGKKANLFSDCPVSRQIAAVSVGIVDGKARLDLDYALDASADVDMNVAQTSDGRFVELQAAAEIHPFTRDELNRLLDLAAGGIKKLFTIQKQALQGPLQGKE